MNGKVGSSKRNEGRPERYDEDGLDDFIEDDVGDGGYVDRPGGDGAGAHGMSGGGGVSEAQISEHLEIFGTDFLDFMGTVKEEEDDDADYDDDLEGRKRRRKKNKYHEDGVGVDLGVDSDDEVDYSDSDDDDDDDDEADLFDDDDLDPDMGDKQRADLLKLKREKKRLAREERRKERKSKVEAKRKARLRRAFEPVQLVENFCTDRDDAIRITDSPERYYDWLESSSKNKKVVPKLDAEITPDEEEQAFWIMSKIPAIHSEWNAIVSALATPTDGGAMETEEDVEKKQRAVTESIIYALRFMKGEKFEPEFVSRYRKDIVSSPAVQNNLYKIIDEDSEWERMTEARGKIESILTDEQSRRSNEGASGGVVYDELARLKDELKVANDKLDRAVKDEESVKVEIEALENSDESKKKKEEEDDDDDDLFGDDDDDDDDAEVVSSHICVAGRCD